MPRAAIDLGLDLFGTRARWRLLAGVMELEEPTAKGSRGFP